MARTSEHPASNASTNASKSVKSRKPSALKSALAAPASNASTNASKSVKSTVGVEVAAQTNGANMNAQGETVVRPGANDASGIVDVARSSVHPVPLASVLRSMIVHHAEHGVEARSVPTMSPAAFIAWATLEAVAGIAPRSVRARTAPVDESVQAVACMRPDARVDSPMAVLPRRSCRSGRWCHQAFQDQRQHH